MSELTQIKAMLAELSKRLEDYDNAEIERADPIVDDLKRKIETELRARLFFTRIYVRRTPRRVILNAYFLNENGRKADKQIYSWDIPHAAAAEGLWPEIKRVSLGIDLGIREIVGCLLDQVESESP